MQWIEHGGDSIQYQAPLLEKHCQVFSVTTHIFFFLAKLWNSSGRALCFLERKSFLWVTYSQWIKLGFHVQPIWYRVYGAEVLLMESDRGLILLWCHSWVVLFSGLLSLSPNMNKKRFKQIISTYAFPLASVSKKFICIDYFSNFCDQIKSNGRKIYFGSQIYLLEDNLSW